MWLTKAHTSQEAPTSISGSGSLTAKKYNEILEELKRLRYCQEIDKRIKNVKAGKGELHELIEVDDI